MRQKIVVSALVLLGILSIALHAQEDMNPHQIQEIVINVDGRTKISAIKKFIDIKEGDSYATETDLLFYVKRVKQDLINYRVFHEVEAAAQIISRSNGITYWRMTVDVRDSWTLIPIPYPKYDSNTGFRLGLKTYYNNAFGSMTDLYLGLGMSIGPNKTTENWEIGEFTINPRWNGIRIGSLRFSVGYLQAYEQQNFDSGNKSTEFHFGYNRSEISIGSSLSFLRNTISYGFSAAFNMNYAYRNYLSTSNYREERFGFQWRHSLSTGEVDWIENFRTGQSISLGHSIGPVYNPDTEKFKLVNGFSLTGSFYRKLGKIINYYSRASIFLSINSLYTGIASNLRGVADNSMSGDWGIFFNNTLAIQFWRLEGIWDAQVHPFFDIGITSMYEGTSTDRDIRYSAGLDFVLYLDALPNLVARGMIGADLSRYDWNDIRKYELTITSSLMH